jgi:hypothetical protein
MTKLAKATPAALLAVLFTACGGGGGSGTTSPPPVGQLYVDPLGGSDAAAGSRDAPFKTIGKALSVASAPILPKAMRSSRSPSPTA